MCSISEYLREINNFNSILPMRILLIIKYFNFGGSENHVCELANALATNGHRVWLFSRAGRQLDRLEPSVRHQRLNLSDIFLPVQIIRLVNVVRQHDIQMIHAHQRLAIKICSLLGKLTGVPVVATVHGKSRHDLGGSFCRKNLTRVIFVSHHILKRAAKFRELRGKSIFIRVHLCSSVVHDLSCFLAIGWPVDVVCSLG